MIALIGKLIGFGREMLIAAYYGATAESDAFFFANSMPTMMFPTVCSSVSTAFVSLYVKRLENDGEALGDRYASRMLNTTVLLGLTLSMIGVLLSPLFVTIFAPGFAAGQKELAVHLSRLSMASFVLSMLQYMLTAILNSKQRFVSVQISALFYSLCVVTITVIIGSGQSMDALMWTVIFAALIQTLALVVCCIGHFRYRPAEKPFYSETAQLLHLALPILLGNSVIQINTIVDKALGSMLPEASLSALNYGNVLSSLVTSVFVVSLSTVLYPTLTSSAAQGNTAQYKQMLTESLSGLSLLLIPISVITVLSAKDIVSFAYARGAFDEKAVEYTAVVLTCYGPMFVFSGIREILTRGFFAVQDTKTPMWNSSIGVGCNIVFSLLFVRWLGIAGIALGTTVSSLISAILLLRSIRKKRSELSLQSFFQNFLRQCIAGIGVLIVLLWFRRQFVLPSALLRFLAAAAVGFSVYALLLMLLHYPKLRYQRR